MYFESAIFNLQPSPRVATSLLAKAKLFKVKDLIQVRNSNAPCQVGIYDESFMTTKIGSFLHNPWRKSGLKRL